MLVVLQGKNGPEYRVGFNNFYVITRYNRSTMYAMAVHDLGHAIQDFMRDTGDETARPLQVARLRARLLARSLPARRLLPAPRRSASAASTAASPARQPRPRTSRDSRCVSRAEPRSRKAIRRSTTCSGKRYFVLATPTAISNAASRPGTALAFTRNARRTASATTCTR